MNWQQAQDGKQRARELASPDDLKKIIQGDDAEAVEKLDEIANHIGKELANRKLTTSQIRNVFGEVRTIELAVKSETGSELSPANYRRLIMLKPKMAYQVGREKVRSDKHFSIDLLATVLTDAINLVQNQKSFFNNFVNFFEAILAYHRYHGGKTSAAK